MPGGMPSRREAGSGSGVVARREAGLVMVVDGEAGEAPVPRVRLETGMGTDGQTRGPRQQGRILGVPSRKWIAQMMGGARRILRSLESR
jgi:hypothetical protein